jgi:hypothetical protein
MVEEDVLKGFGGTETVHVGGNGRVVALSHLLLLRQVDGVLVFDREIDLKTFLHFRENPISVFKKPLKEPLTTNGYFLTRN